ncbi:hypothetical protein WH47_10746 [Habropoda laboriosa]|uniref:Uncharacterized protein n=1 Tax=Habropoda laboriosa TaxID=597456 RepID=A0A0L7RCM9_9HYME|nr:PREDICTED: uncharacterized protein LOC108579753 [Habropoda laboriosa]KOC68506.1 hypothetical protein WH47_10746 [Habropoda laboriosa]
MKQAENYKTKYAAHSYPDARDSPESYWRHQQRKSQSFPLGKGSKIPESSTNYYSSPSSYKSQRGHVCSSPTYTKYTTLHNSDASHLQNHSKPNRDKYYASFSPTRKARYEDELGNVTKLKFTNEDLEDLAQDNVEEDAEEEATEDDREETCEFLNKDYEEQEADDEIDEESDASPLVRRAQRGGKNETLLRQPQRWRAMEQQTDSRRPRYQQCVPLVQNHPSSPKYYHVVAEHEVPEPLSDEDFVRTSLRNPTRRQPAEYRQWSSSRNDPDRYDDVIQSTRRSSIKPEGNRLLEPELVRIRRCNRCGSLSTSKRNELPMKNSCRFDDRVNIPTKGPIGDEPESLAYCGRCNLRYSTKDTSDAIDIPSSPYHAKFRKPREIKSPTIYEVPEQGQVNKLSNDYTRSTRYQRKAADAFTEKSKRALHTSHGTARIPSRYTE